jgi:hypothetical protein
MNSEEIGRKKKSIGWPPKQRYTHRHIGRHSITKMHRASKIQIQRYQKKANGALQAFIIETTKDPMVMEA